MFAQDMNGASVLLVEQYDGVARAEESKLRKIGVQADHVNTVDDAITYLNAHDSVRVVVVDSDVAEETDVQRIKQTFPGKKLIIEDSFAQTPTLQTNEVLHARPDRIIETIRHCCSRQVQAKQ